MPDKIVWPAHCRRGHHGRPCIYRGSTWSVPTCDFALITGKCRLVPMEECPYWQDEKARRGQEPGVHTMEAAAVAAAADQPKRIRAETERHKRMRQMYEHGMDDREIAVALAVHPTTVAWWRRSQGLPTQQEASDRRRWELARQMSERGASDAEVAREIKSTVETVRRKKWSEGWGGT